MYAHDVTKSKENRRRRISDAGKDKRIFSETADRTHSVNSNNTARPMRGGIRL